MRQTWLCLLLAAGAAHAEISLVKPMTKAECHQVLRETTDMYYDNHYCATESNAQTQQHAMIAWYAAGEINSRSGNEAFGRCPALRIEDAEKPPSSHPTPNRTIRRKPPVSAPPTTAPASPCFTRATAC